MAAGAPLQAGLPDNRMNLYERFWKTLDARRETDGTLPPDFPLAMTAVHPPEGALSEAARDIATIVRRSPRRFPAMVVSQPAVSPRPFCFIYSLGRGELPEFAQLFENYVDKNAFIAETLLRLRPHYDMPYVLFVGETSFFLYDVQLEELLRWGTDFNALDELILQPAAEGADIAAVWNGVSRKSVAQRSEEFGRWLDLWKACIGARMNTTPATVEMLMQKVILLFLYDLHFGLADHDMRLRTNFLDQRRKSARRGRKGGDPDQLPFDGVAWLHEASQEVRDRYRMEFLFWNEAETTFFALLTEEGRRQFSQFVLELFLLSQSKLTALVQTDVFSDPDAKLKLWKFAVTEDLNIRKRLHMDDINVYQAIPIDLEESGVGWAMHVVTSVLAFWRERVTEFREQLSLGKRVQVQFDMFQQPDIEHARVPTERDIFETAFSTSIRVIYENPADRATLEYLMILKVFEFSREWNLPLQPLDNIADAFVRKEHFEGIEEL